MGRAHRRVRNEIKDLLYLLDSTPICLRGRGYEWTQARSMSRIPGLKIHLLYSPDKQLPCDARITASTQNDIEYGRNVEIEKGAKYVFDKGYCDYNWWHQIDQEGAFFVTRLKRNASIRVLKSRSTEGDILSDEVIEFKNKWPGGGRKNNYVKPLRRIVVHREDHVDPLVLVTNLMGGPG